MPARSPIIPLYPLWHHEGKSLLGETGGGSLPCNGAQAMKLRPFQQRFLDGALAPGCDLGVLSLARGNGKSWLAGFILTKCLTPGDVLHEPGKEYILVASSLEQARIVFGFIRGALEANEEYRWLDSTTRIGVLHKPSNTRLRVLSSKAKSAFGLVNVPLLILDEPGSLEVVGGTLLADALFSAQGKPNSSLRIICIGTLSPASPGGWWHDLVDGGSNKSTYVQRLVGDVKRWDEWREIKRCNPLVAISDEFKKKLLDERDQARRDPRLKARFLSYRLNRPTGDESTMLLSVSDFEDMAKRAVPPREGQPIVSLDLGSSRAWSAACSLYRNGRIEARALAPGIPSLADQEARDGVPKGTYSRLADQGVLVQAEGLRVPPVRQLMKLVADTWGRPAGLICDRFRIDELRDAGVPCQITPRVTRWSESSFDIRALRSRTKDGPFAVEQGSRSLLAASLSAAMVKNDDAGSFRLIKKGFNNKARDDVAAALVLAAGLFERTAQPRNTWRTAGIVGA